MDTMKSKGKRGPKKGTHGRPAIKIDREQVLKLAEGMWTVTAIAAFFKCCTDTIYKNVSSTEMDAAKQLGDGKVLQALHNRALGGRQEKVQPDGSIQIYHTRPSDRLMAILVDRRLGRVKQQIDVNPNPTEPMNVNVTIDRATLRAAIEQLESEF